jgi:RNA polymerase sigma-70 factor (ECF subfamily)
MTQSIRKGPRAAGHDPIARDERVCAAEDEARLLRDLQAGDDRSMRTIWTQLAPAVERTLRRLLGPDVDPQDLAQEAFLRFFDRVDRVTAPSALRPFLWGICVRVAREEMRRRRARRWLRLTADGELPEVTPRSPGEGADARDAVLHLYRALDRLNDLDRSLFVLRFLERLDIAEIAEIHDLSLSTVRRKLDRVWKRARSLMANDPLLRRYLDDAAPAGARST